MMMDKTGSWENLPQEIRLIMNEKRNLGYEGFSIQVWVSKWELDYGAEKMIQTPIEWLIIKKNILCNETGIGVLPEFSYCYTDNDDYVVDVQEVDEEMRMFILTDAGEDLSDEINTISYSNEDEEAAEMPNDFFDALFDNMGDEEDEEQD